MNRCNMMKRFILIAGLLLGCVCYGAGAKDVFKWSLAEEPDATSVKVAIPDGSYLYKDKTSVAPQTASGTGPKLLSAPASTFFEPLPGSGHDCYIGPGVFIWKFEKTTEPVTFKIVFQGCGIKPPVCYLPVRLELKTSTAADVPGPVAGKAAEKASLESLLAKFKVVSTAGGYMPSAEFIRFLGGEEKSSADFLGGKSLVVMIFLVILGGLMLNLTPCVLPLIPVNLAIIGAGIESKSRWGGFVRGLSYGAGMAAAYGVLGLAAVLSGARFGNLNSTPWFNFAIALLFLFFALSMFDICRIDFSGIGAKFNPAASQKGKIVTAFVLGGAAALLAGSCIAPVVLAVLLHSARIYADGNIAGLLLPFLLGFGMALPWPFAGAGLSVLPRPGKWMVWIKTSFGAMILLFAIYYVYVGASLFYFRSDWSAGAEIGRLTESLEAAEKSRKPVLIDVWAPWCGACMHMERTTMKMLEVRKAIEPYEFIKFRAEDPSDPLIKRVLDHFDIAGLPAYIILKPAAKE